MHLLHGISTDLMGAIDFGGIDLQTCVITPEYLQDAPWRYRPLQRPALVVELDRRIQHLMRHPTETELHESGHRRVQVLGTAVFSIAPGGVVKCAIWGQKFAGQLALDVQDDDCVGAEHSPYMDRWFDGFRDGLYARMAHTHGHKHHELLVHYLDWVQERVVKRYWTNDAAAVVRDQITSALALDNATLARARSIYRLHDQGRVMLSDYNRALTRTEVDNRLLAETPQLALLHSLLAPILKDKGERAQAMRDYLLKRGISRGMWALLHKEGSDWLREYLPYYWHGVSTVAATVDILLVVQGFGTRSLAESTLVHGLMALGGHPNSPSRSANYAEKLADLLTLASRMGSLYRMGSPDTQDLLKEWSHDIFNWADKGWARVSRDRRAFLKVSGLIRLVMEHWEVEELQLRNMPAWELPWTLTSDLDGLECHILQTALEVWGEGRRMHHCVADRIDACAKKHYLVASIRHMDSGKGVATVGFHRSRNGFTFEMVSGPANQLVSPEVKALALDCARQLNEQIKQASKTTETATPCANDSDMIKAA